MEHYIFYCKLSLLAVLSLITACCMLSRRWYVNLAAFLACLSGETFLAYLFFPGYILCPAAASFIILFLSRGYGTCPEPRQRGMGLIPSGCRSGQESGSPGSNSITTTPTSWFTEGPVPERRKVSENGF